MRRSLTVVAIVALALVEMLWLTGAFDRLALWAAGQQRAFQNIMATALRSARAGEPGAVATLIGACFAYGLAHAAGPGHGKVLIGGYGFARSVPMLRLSLIGLAASLGQAVTAVALVVAGIFVLGLGREAMVGVTEDIMAPASYAAIALIGLWLVWRGVSKLIKRQPHDPHDHHGHGVCDTCGHAHGPTLSQVEQTRTLRDAVVLVGGIAIRPCTGALFVLIITWQMGIFWLGILGTFAMAIGTAIITISVGLAALGMRSGLLANLSGSSRAARITAGVEAVAGAVVVFLATGLLLRVI